MAAPANQQQTVMLEGVTIGDTEIVTVTGHERVVGVEEVTEDILQQALGEVNEDFDESAVVYTSESQDPSENGVVYTAESQVQHDNGVVYTTENQVLVQDSHQNGVIYTTDGQNPHENEVIYTTESQGQHDNGVIYATDTPGHPENGVVYTAESQAHGHTENSVVYTTESQGHTENSVVYATEGHIQSKNGVISSNTIDEPVTEIQLAMSNSVSGAENNVYTLVGADENSILNADQDTLQQVVLQAAEGQQYVEEDSIPTEENIVYAQSELETREDSPGLPSTTPGPGPGTTTLQITTSDGAPVGSSGNPIRIVQQGNQYTSLQQLTPEQLAQIMQVVQQQQLSKITAEGGGSSVLFNPQTQTRIVYKVLYPSELHKNSSGQTTIGASQIVHKINLPSASVGKRTYRKRHRDDDDKADGPDLSKEEKEERKKARPRTRSGRVSRPPKHMVKDYKHIHHLDWDEPDYDDSDGGYSDYKVSDEDAEGNIDRRHRSDSAYTHPGLGTSKPKKWKCESCDKAYIGRAGLARHYKLTPSHGFLEEEPEDHHAESSEGKPPAEASPVSNDAGASNQNANDAEIANRNGDINEEDTSTQDSNTSHGSTTTTTQAPVKPTPAPRIPKGAIKLKQQYMQENTPLRRKARLKELIRQCEDEELMEIVLPRLTKAINVWEFLLMKVEKGKPIRPHFADIFREFENLQKQVQKMCQEYLKPATEGADCSNRIQLTDPNLAGSLGLNVGAYDIVDGGDHRIEEPRHYTLLTTAPPHRDTNQTTKRSVQVVSQDQLVAPPSKRPHLAIVMNSQTNRPQVVTTMNMTTTQQNVDSKQTVQVPTSHISVSKVEKPIESSHPLLPPKSEQSSAVVIMPKIDNDIGESNATRQQHTELVNGDSIVQSSVASTVPVTTNVVETTAEETGLQQHKELEEEEATPEEVQYEVSETVQQVIQEDGTHIQYVQEGDLAEEVTSEQETVETAQMFQTESGIILIRNPDGTFQMHHNDDQATALETVQALLAMEAEGQVQIQQAVHQGQS